ncbi:MAG: lysylphosphatidylglycerol synthase transmembrane domain-containing protein [Syntrophobacteraceae bacterium]
MIETTESGDRGGQTPPTSGVNGEERSTLEQDSDQMAPRPVWGWPTALSITAALAILAGFASVLDWGDIRERIGGCDKRLVLAGALAHYGSYIFRGVRWRRSLAQFSIAAGWKKFSLLMFFCNFVDNILPGKVIDFYAAHLARINFGIRRSEAMGSIMFLRMVDMWLLLGLAGLSSFVLFSEGLPPSITWSLIFGAVLSIGIAGGIALFALSNRMRLEWIPEKARRMIGAFRVGMLPPSKQLLPIALLTLVIWAMEAAWIFCLAWAFDVRVGLTEGVFLTTIPLIASAFPLTPSGTGVVELTLYSCLHVLGAPSATAASLTVLNRLIDYWLHNALGAVTWAFRDTLGFRSWRETKGGVLPQLSCKGLNN